MKNMPAGQEDAEEEQKAPKAGDILNEQDAFLLKNSRNIIEGLGRHLIEERRLKEQALLESDRHKQRADDMAEEAKQAHEDARRKDEIINRKMRKSAGCAPRASAKTLPMPKKSAGCVPKTLPSAKPRSPTCTKLPPPVTEKTPPHPTLSPKY